MENLDQTDRELGNMFHSIELGSMSREETDPNGKSYDRAISSKWKKSWRQEIRRGRLETEDYLLSENDYNYDDELTDDSDDTDAQSAPFYDPIGTPTTFEKIPNKLLALYVPVQHEDQRSQGRQQIKIYQNIIREMIRRPSVPKTISGRLNQLNNESATLHERTITAASKDEKKEILKQMRSIEIQRTRLEQKIKSTQQLAYYPFKTTRLKLAKIKRKRNKTNEMSKWTQHETRVWRETLQGIRDNIQEMAKRATSRIN